jgi:hypothetical protein
MPPHLAALAGDVPRARWITYRTIPAQTNRAATRHLEALPPGWSQKSVAVAGDLIYIIPKLQVSYGVPENFFLSN